MSKYPLTEGLGLFVQTGSLVIHGGSGGPKDYIRADDLERLLEKGARIIGHKSEYGWVWGEPHSRAKNTHTALLIGIKPIQKDTAEQILKDLIETAESLNSGPNPMLSVGYYVDRAKRLLEQNK